MGGIYEDQSWVGTRVAARPGSAHLESGGDRATDVGRCGCASLR